MNINFQYRAEQELSERLSPAGRLHSQLAMRAAKGMAVTRQKSRHGRVVCHHLLRMLSSERSRGGKVISEFQLTAPVSETGGFATNSDTNSAAAIFCYNSATNSTNNAGAIGFQRHGPRVSAQAQQYSLGF